MGMYDPLHVCISCGHVGVPKDLISGSFIGELALWIIAVIIASFSSWLLLIGPLIYSIYRANSKNKGCELCGNTQIIPADSPNGQELISKNH